MTFPEILQKLQKAEALTDEEKDFLAKFDYTADLNAAAAKARRKAEEDAKKKDEQIAQLTTQIEEAKKAAESKGAEGKGEIERLTGLVTGLQKQVSEWEKKAQDAEAENKRVKRIADIDAFAKENGISPAQGVKEATFMKFFREAVGEADLANAEQMKAVVDKFKADYAGIFANGGAKAPSSGSPAKGGSGYTGPNPWKKETENATAQYEIYKSDPDMARKLAAEAGVPIPG